MLLSTSWPSAAGGRPVDSTAAEAGWARGKRLPSKACQPIPNLTDGHSQFKRDTLVRTSLALQL